jgi:signal transduction histidine kinase
MPQFSAPEALELMKESGLDLPFIIVSGHIEEETAVAAMNSGAHDYIMKDRLARLVPVIQRELREATVRRAQKESEENLRRAHDELEGRVEKRTADLRHANVRLQNALEERRRLENELLEIAENERRSIGFDLHDDLGQRLTGMCMMVKGLHQKLLSDKHAAAEDAGKIHELMEDVINHTHNLARQFSSMDMKGDDLPSVLNSLADNIQKMFPASCRVEIKGVLPELPENTCLQLYKIAQEAVSNAIKHGNAHQVGITVHKDGDSLVLSVRNDGVPFSLPAKSKNRMGLRIMNYRASTIGASLDIKPEKAGTLLTCALALKNGSKTARKGSEIQKHGNRHGNIEVLTHPADK